VVNPSGGEFPNPLAGSGLDLGFGDGRSLRNWPDFRALMMDLVMPAKPFAQ